MKAKQFKDKYYRFYKTKTLFTNPDTFFLTQYYVSAFAYIYVSVSN